MHLFWVVARNHIKNCLYLFFAGIRTSNGTIAFYAYMTTSLISPGYLRTLIFDAIFTNEGSGYHHHMGVFIAPRTGLYVFTWTIRADGGSYFNTQLLVNGLIYGWMYSSDNYNTDSSSTTAVVRVAFRIRQNRPHKYRRQHKERSEWTFHFLWLDNRLNVSLFTSLINIFLKVTYI